MEFIPVPVNYIHSLSSYYNRVAIRLGSVVFMI